MNVHVHSPRRAERGVALVITLFFVCIITVLVVGFLDTSRVERASAQTHAERLRATILAQEGIEATIATLRRETADPVRNWTSQPGQLTVPAEPPADQKRLTKTVPLSSGPPSAAFLAKFENDPIYAAPNLNVLTLEDQEPATYLLDDPATGEKAREMKLRWVYVRRDPVERLRHGIAYRSNFLLNAIDEPIEPGDPAFTLDPQNPIVGRFAYWADDESSKVNYNLAWTRDPALNAAPPGHQTKVDLRALPLFDGDEQKPEPQRLSNKLHRRITDDAYYTTIRRFFNTPFDARTVNKPEEYDPALRAALDRNKFNLTHYNSDPDTTFFGKERLVLTTQKKNAEVRGKDGKVIRTRPFLDILTTDNSDPGAVQAINSAKLADQMDLLVNQYLKRTDWPMVDGTGHSLQEKYYAGKSERLAQLALNIIDYVRSAESSRIMVEPIRGKYNAAGRFAGDWADSSLRGKDDSYKGLTRALTITEMGVWVEKDPVSPAPAWKPANIPALYRTKLFVEVHLPLNYGIEEIDLRNPNAVAGQRLAVYFWPCTRGSGTNDLKHYEPAFGGRPTWVAPASGEETFFIIHAPGERAGIPAGNVLEAQSDPTKMIIKAGEYRTLVCEFYRSQPSTSTPTMTLRGAIATASDKNNNGRADGGFNARFDVAPLGDVGSATGLIYALDPPGTPEEAVGSVEVDDPRVNGVASDWRKVSRNTFGKRNATYSAGNPPAGSLLPEQDMDQNGRLTDASLRMPYRKGTPQNPNGRVRSSGELGIVHTGIEGRSKGIVGGGISWRTLRLQPSKQGTTVVPDWAFMDLFTVPADVPEKAAVLFAPRGSSTGGRVNMNAQPVPFDLDRTDPLVAVLYGCRKTTTGTGVVTIEEARTIAKNIYERRRADANKALPAGKPYPLLKPGVPNVFESPGEVVEIAGVADDGEESEELVREIANLITARGNVFSIYTVGQALKQTPDGKLVVTAEQRQHAFVERFLSDKGTQVSTDDETRFRTVYFRNLTP